MRRKNQPTGGGSGVSEAARGPWTIVGVVMWGRLCVVGCSDYRVDSVSGAEHLFTPPLIKINGPSLLLGRLLPIHLSDVARPFCCPNSDSFRTVLRAHLGKGQHSPVQINDMALMAEGMTFTLHHSSDLRDGEVIRLIFPSIISHLNTILISC